MMALVSTCGKCQTPIRKTFSRLAYEKGVVLVTCPGCRVRHLVADHLGWLADHSTRAGAAPSRVDLASQYGARLVRASLAPQLRPDGSVAPAVQLEQRNHEHEHEQLFEGLTQEELLSLYAKATRQKD